MIVLHVLTRDAGNKYQFQDAVISEFHSLRDRDVVAFGDTNIGEPGLLSQTIRMTTYANTIHNERRLTRKYTTCLRRDRVVGSWVGFVGQSLFSHVLLRDKLRYQPECVSRGHRTEHRARSGRSEFLGCPIHIGRRGCHPSIW